jgi:hypothetical protein
MKLSSRPPTQRMIDKLKECHEKEQNGEKFPCLPEEMKSSLAGLYTRGLIETKMQVVNNKKILCIYVSDTGRKFLIDWEKKEMKNKSKNT